MKRKITILLLIIYSACYSQSVTVDQQLVVVQNDAVTNGTFSVEVQVQGPNLPSACTLGSATIDVIFDPTKMTFVNANNWAFGFLDGYIANAVNPAGTSLVRIGVTGGSVFPGAGLGYDITDTYDPWVQLNFKIIDASGPTSLSIDSWSNAIGIFQNYQNNPQTNVITDQTLSQPIIILDVPLPVELVSFTSQISGKDVILNWKTATEVNNYGFDVERATSSSTTWKKIGFVKGNGNSNSPKNYSFIDNPLGDVKFQYRLKQIDFGGTFEYSDPITVLLQTPSNFILHENYPNPFNPTTNIRFELPAQSNVVLKVFNILGEKISTVINKSMSAGTHVVTFDASNLPSGIYLYRIEAHHIDGAQSSDFTQVKKMLLTK